MSTSRDRVEDTYEGQNDQRLDELHAKIRTLRGITTDINEDVERQNLMLDDTSNTFSSFGNSLTQTSRRALQAFGIGEGAGRLKTWRIVAAMVSLFLAGWVTLKVWGWWQGSPSAP